METLTQNLKIKKIAQTRIHEVDFDNLKFGRTFSDHMVVITYENGAWSNGEVVPFDYLPMNPATLVLHYGQAIFEGMKAEKTADGKVVMFRPELNARRFNRSAIRMAMPEIPEEVYVNSLMTLLDIDRDWIPTKEGSSLYMRPFMYAADEFIGVQPSSTYKFIIFTCPVGAYYSKPVNVFIEEHYSRAASGGTGFAKAAGNYAGSLYPAQLAKANGYDQIMWTDSEEHKYIQEAGTMNLFFVIDDKVITPELNDCILPGTTRQTIIELYKEDGIVVEERKISVDEVFAASENGTLQDVFGAGTAAVVTYVASIGKEGMKIELPPIGERTYSTNMKKKLTDIKKGITPDTRDWLLKF